MLSQEWLVRKTILVITLLTLLTGTLVAPTLASTSQNTPFNYDPDKIEPGTMYVYQMSTNPKEFQAKQEKAYFIKTSSKEKVKIAELSRENGDNPNVDYTHITLNMGYMMLQSMSFKALQPRKEVALNTTVNLRAKTDFRKKENQVSFENRKESGIKRRNPTFKFEHIPTFFYYTNHVDLWTIMRFYPYPKDQINVWNFTGTHLSKIEINYLGKETVKVPAGKFLCYKFKLSGKGFLAWLFGKKAWLWMNAENSKNFMIKYKNNNPRGHWPMLELRLSKVKKTSIEEWKKKIAEADRRNGTKGS